MKFSWFFRLLARIQYRKHIFIIKPSGDGDVSVIAESISINPDAEVDVYSKCEDVLYKMNKNKNKYTIGAIASNDKKNPADIFANILRSINPRIKIVNYTQKIL